MTVYKHYRPSRVWLPIAMLAFVGLGFMVVGGGLLIHAEHSEMPPFFLAFPLAIFGINLWFLARIAYEVRLEGTSIELKAPLRRVRVPICEITRLAPWEVGQGGWFLLQHRSGRILLDPRLDGMHELVAEIKRQNPAVELRGC